jgi:hypothetical protein
MDAPERLLVPTCIGCGAMAEPGNCERGCSEQRLDLVRAAAHDQLIAAAAHWTASADAFQEVAEHLATQELSDGTHERAYRAVQDAARAALRRHPDEADLDLLEPAEPAITWWCARCGGIDAPRPCLGICIWRATEWINRAAYEQQREHALNERDREQQLRRLLRRVVAVTPRPGQWERSWNVLQADARNAALALGPTIS